MLLSGIAHVGIRVHDLERSLAFYRLLGFEKTAGPLGPEPVAILDHPAGIEINLVLNAPAAKTPNVLMDVPVKAPGITHIALKCTSIEAAIEQLGAAGHTPSGGPVKFPNGSRAVFFRDPDGVVIELNQGAV
jgi:lactoylglutathione lyase